MSTSKERVLARERDRGKADALDLQSRASGMSGTEIIAEEYKVPAFDPAKDYSSWEAGSPVSDEEQVWLLLIPHNAANYTGRPSGNRAMWGLAHTTDPQKAKPWVGPYGNSGIWKVDECCTYPHTDGTTHVFRNLYANNEYPPLTLNVEDRWEDLGEVGDV